MWNYELALYVNILLQNKKEGNKLLHEIDFSPETAVQFADEMEQIGRALYNRGKYQQALVTKSS